MNRKHYKLIIGLFSVYTSFFFLIASRFIYTLEYPLIKKGQFGDFSLWMGHIPFAIKIAIYIPLIIGIAFIISYYLQFKKEKEKAQSNSKQEFGDD